MSTPDAEDASSSPEYSGDDMAAEHSTDHPSDEGSPSQKLANGKPVTKGKDPLRPRRKKAKRACYACQRAHLTCADDRPCGRCVKRGIGDACMDGVRKKAKYLHDAPDNALMPGVGGHFPYMNGNRPIPVPSHDSQTVSLSPQGNVFAQPSPTNFYTPNAMSAPHPATQEARNYSNQPPPISPPYSQAQHGPVQHVSNTMSQSQPGELQQFGPMFDPSDPALFNFDISNLNFGNHYGALEFGMLGHMSSGAVDASQEGGMMNMYNQQMPPGYSDQSNPNVTAFGPNGLPTNDWQDASSRQNSMNMQTPHSAAASLDHNGHRQDSLNGPHAFAIGQGPASQATASPASTDASVFENDNPLASAAFFANSNSTTRPHAQHSPVANRSQQNNRHTGTAFQPIHSNGVRKRQRDTKSIYQDINKPYDYVKGYHRLYQIINKNYSRPWVAKAQEYLQNYRPVLLQVREELNTDDLIHQEMCVQRSLVTLQDHFTEVGTPFLICRRSGEVVELNKEFTILTGWKREVLLGHEPNLNVNRPTREAADSELSTQNTTPNLNPQDAETTKPSVNVIELMDPRSALDYLRHFSTLCYQDPRGCARQRVSMIRYQTKADVDHIQETKAAKNAGDVKPEYLVKMESGGSAVHQAESAMQRLGNKNGMVDCMIWWHIKRDIFDMPVLVCMTVMPVLDKGLQ